MTAIFETDKIALHVGDCRKVLATMPECSVDAVVTDPPYELGFMGKAWDKAGVAFDAQTWWHVYRVLKPGAHLLSFGGTRTFHRIAVAIEDAGFEIRDSLAWIYGSGFPKNADVSKLIDKEAGAVRERQEDYRARVPSGSLNGYTVPDGGYNTVDWVPQVNEAVTEEAKKWQGWGTALKPAFEPIIMARKPLSRDATIAQNVQVHGTGAINIDVNRVPVDPTDPVNTAVFTIADGRIYGGGRGLHPRQIGDRVPTKPASGGRWPPNVVLDESQAEEMDRQSGTQRSGVAVQRNLSDTGSKQGDVPIVPPTRRGPDAGYGDFGGASRFFPVFKYVPKPKSRERPRAGEVYHPTIKPVALMRWLVRMVTPPGGKVLDPFMGSGPTVEAALIDGFYPIGIDEDERYARLVMQRVVRAGYAPLHGS